MRRTTAALAVPALLIALTACTDSTGEGADGTTAATDGASPTSYPDADDDATDAAAGTTDAAADATASDATDEAATTTGATDPAAQTADPDEVEGGEEGQAAADVAKAFYVAMIDADVTVCDHLLSFSDASTPMKDHPSDYQTCQELLPEVLERDVAPEGDEELKAIVEAMQIRGADVQGDTAVVDADNYSELFAQTVGQDPITLRKVDDAWYIDLDHSFQTTG